MHLLKLPNELLIEVVIRLYPKDAARLAQANRRLHALIYSKQPLDVLTSDEINQLPCQTTIWGELLYTRWDPSPRLDEEIEWSTVRPAINYLSHVIAREVVAKEIKKFSPSNGIFAQPASSGAGAREPPSIKSYRSVLDNLVKEFLSQRAPKAGKDGSEGRSKNVEHLNEMFPPSHVCINAFSRWIFPGFVNSLQRDWYQGPLPLWSNMYEAAMGAEEIRARLHCLHGVRMLTGPRELASDCAVTKDVSMEPDDPPESTSFSHRASTPTHIPAPDEERDDYPSFGLLSSARSERSKSARHQGIFHRSQDRASYSYSWALAPILSSPEQLSGDVIIRRKAREIVYDCGRYSAFNCWGPFKPWFWIPTLGQLEEVQREDRRKPLTDDDAERLFMRMLRAKADEGDESSDVKAAMIRRDRDALKEAGYDLGAERNQAEQPGPRTLVEDALMTLRYKGSLVLDEAKEKFMKRRQFIGRLSGETDDARLPSIENPLLLEMEIDWKLLEAIIIVLYCNLTVQRAKVGTTPFKLPKEVGETDAEYLRRMSIATSLPSGWNHSRGSADTWTDPKKDWANVEGIWVGTYCFIDYHDFIEFNSRLARWRKIPTTIESPDVALEALRSRPRLAGVGEVAGDLLQLRLSLLGEDDKLPDPEWDTFGPQMEAEQITGPPSNYRYPPLAFTGTSLTYPHDGSEPVLRGTVYGRVTAIYEDGWEADETEPAERVVALRWRMRFAYEDSDRWELNMVQPGPPGSRAPMYGIWSGIEALDGLQVSPVGPSCWMRAHENMTVQEAETLLTEQLNLDRSDPRFRQAL